MDRDLGDLVLHGPNCRCADGEATAEHHLFACHRSALMTGRYPRRVGLEKGWKHAVLVPGDPIGLHPDQATTEVLKKVDCATACFGKWHLSDQPELMPNNQGFDEYFGIAYSKDMWPRLKRWDSPPLPLMRDTEVSGLVKDFDDQADQARLFTHAESRTPVLTKD